MRDHRHLSSGLRERLLAIISGACTPGEVNSVVALCHTLAAAFLAGKRSGGTLSNLSGLSTRDLAYDCIAELFSRDERGCYHQLQAYFCALPMKSARDEEILVHLRRLVFSKVNHGVFRVLGETDPSLARILRNIKLALHSLLSFAEVERFGEPCIVPSLCDPLSHMPAIDGDTLERNLAGSVHGNEFIPEILGKLALYLREQDEYCRVVPIVVVGLVIRRTFIRKNELEAGSAPEGFIPGEIDPVAVIRDACHTVRHTASRKYVTRGKASEEVMTTYFSVIEQSLCRKILDGDGMDGSLFDGLKKLSPGLTKEVYMREHRHRVEYLLKLVQKEMGKRMREEA